MDTSLLQAEQLNLLACIFIIDCSSPLAAANASSKVMCPEPLRGFPGLLEKSFAISLYVAHDPLCRFHFGLGLLFHSFDCMYIGRLVATMH